MPKIDITGLDKAKLLQGLYNNAKPKGLGLISYDTPAITLDWAQQILDLTPTKRFDYVGGKAIKVDLSSDHPYTDDYDYFYGKGAMEKIVAAVREGKEVLPNDDPSEYLKDARRLQYTEERHDPEVAKALGRAADTGFGAVPPEPDFQTSKVIKKILENGPTDPNKKDGNDLPPR